MCRYSHWVPFSTDRSLRNWTRFHSVFFHFYDATIYENVFAFYMYLINNLPLPVYHVHVLLICTVCQGSVMMKYYILFKIPIFFFKCFFYLFIFLIVVMNVESTFSFYNAIVSLTIDFWLLQLASFMSLPMVLAICACIVQTASYKSTPWPPFIVCKRGSVREKLVSNSNKEY